MDLYLGDTAIILSECQAAGLPRNQAAYVLATAKWETAHTMKPVRETLAKTDASAVSRLDHAFKTGKLPWVKSAYWRYDAQGKTWLGRGYVQLTHRENYVRAGRKLGVDLDGNPAKAMQPDIAAKVLVIGMAEGWFTGKKLADYITLQKSDFVNARRIVNGRDKAHEIASLAKEYDAALITSGYAIGAPEPKERPLAASTTLQASGGQIAAGAGVAATSIGYLDGTAQLVVVALAGVVILGALWIMRERIRHWAEGVK